MSRLTSKQRQAREHRRAFVARVKEWTQEQKRTIQAAGFQSWLNRLAAESWAQEFEAECRANFWAYVSPDPGPRFRKLPVCLRMYGAAGYIPYGPESVAEPSGS